MNARTRTAWQKRVRGGTWRTGRWNADRPKKHGAKWRTERGERNRGERPDWVGWEAHLGAGRVGIAREWRPPPTGKGGLWGRDSSRLVWRSDFSKSHCPWLMFPRLVCWTKLRFTFTYSLLILCADLHEACCIAVSLLSFLIFSLIFYLRRTAYVSVLTYCLSCTAASLFIYFSLITTCRELYILYIIYYKEKKYIKKRKGRIGRPRMGYVSGLATRSRYMCAIGYT